MKTKVSGREELEEDKIALTLLLYLLARFTLHVHMKV